MDDRNGAQKYADELAFRRYSEGRVDFDSAQPFCSVSDDGFVDFTFHPGQSKAMNSEARFIIALAGRQGGKSEIGAPWLLQEMQAKGPGLYMVVAPSFPILFDSVYPKMLDLFKHKMNLGEPRSKPFAFIISREGEKTLFADTPWESEAGTGKLPPTLIRFCHAQNAASLEAKTALACVFDEAGQEEVKPEAMEAIEGRLTTTQGRCLFTSTPYSMNWLYRRYYLPWAEARARGEKHPDIEVIQWSSYVNPAFPRAEYDRLKKTMPAWRHAMFYDGQFTRPAGMIYDCFSEDEHTCAPFDIPEHWPRYLGMDFGGSNTAALYIAENPNDGQMYLYRTYLEGNRNEHEHLRAMTMPSEHSSFDDYFDRVGGGAAAEKVWRELYRRAGLYVEEPPLRGQGSVEAGIDCVYAWLSGRRIQIFSDQTEFIHEINTYSREIDAETGDVIPGTIHEQNRFHRLDALRAICGLLSRTGSGAESRVGGSVGMDERYAAHGDRLRQSILRGDGGHDSESAGRMTEEEIREAQQSVGTVAVLRAGVLELGANSPYGGVPLPPPSMLALPPGRG